MSTTARDNAWDDQMSLIIDIAAECTEGVTVKGIYEPCGATAVAVRIDPDQGTPYQVCARHARHEMVPLVTVIDVAKDAGRTSVLSSLTEERIARALWGEATEEGDDPEWTWDYLVERANRGDGDYSEIREGWFRAARAVLALIERETSK